MILTCPQCASRFLLPATSLSPEGRHVKCSNCGEIWEQLPDPEELAEFEQPEEEAAEGEQDFEDIPDAVKPIPEGSSVPALAEDEKSLKDKLIGPAIVAGLSFVLILIVLLALNKPITGAFPSTAGFFKTFGISMKIPGEGLVFDKVQASTEGGHIILNGTIINLTSDEKKMPHIDAVIRDSHGEELEVWSIAPPVKTIEKEGVQPFSAQIAPEHEGGEDIHLRFVIKPSKDAKPAKIDEVDGDNTHAPPAGDQTHQSDGAAHGESPGHASAAPHQESGSSHPGTGHAPDPHQKGGQADHSASGHH